MAQTRADFFASDEGQGVVQDGSKALKAAVAELPSLVAGIMAAGQALEGSKGPASADKQDVLKALGEQAWPIVSSLHACCVANDWHD